MNKAVVGLLSILIISVSTSCKKEEDTGVYGCTQEYALNYNPDAEHSDGSCSFPGHYTLDKIRLVSFPVLDSYGLPWDTTDGPDVFFEFRDIVGTLIYGSPVASNLTSEYTWDLNPDPWVKCDTNLYFYLKFFDNDAGGDSLMTTFNPYFYDYTNHGSQSSKYPDIITLSSDSVVVELQGSWVE